MDESRRHDSEMNDKDENEACECEHESHPTHPNVLPTVTDHEYGFVVPTAELAMIETGLGTTVRVCAHCATEHFDSEFEDKIEIEDEIEAEARSVIQRELALTEAKIAVAETTAEEIITESLDEARAKPELESPFPLASSEESAGPCKACGQQIPRSLPNEHPLSLCEIGEDRFHRVCLTKEVATLDLRRNPIVSVKMNMRVDEIAQLSKLLDTLTLNDTLNDILKKHRNLLNNAIVEHDSWYATCSDCGRLVQKNDAWMSVHTKNVREEFDPSKSAPLSRTHGKAREIKVFCSEVCDRHFAGRERSRLVAELEEKKVSRSIAAEKKIPTRTSQLAKALAMAQEKAGENPEVAELAARLMSLIAGTTKGAK